jgi:hypothetical protein
MNMPNPVVKNRIEKSLSNIQRLFKAENKNRHGDTYISLQFQLPKLAVLELSGWVEQTQDKIVLELLRLKGIEGSKISNFKKDFVEKNYNPSWDNFRKMLIQVMGYGAICELEETHTLEIARIKSRLSTLKRVRDDLAHTLERSSPSIDDPKTTRALLYAPLCSDLRFIHLFLKSKI